MSCAAGSPGELVCCAKTPRCYFYPVLSRYDTSQNEKGQAFFFFCPIVRNSAFKMLGKDKNFLACNNCVLEREYLQQHEIGTASVHEEALVISTRMTVFP